MSSLSASMDPSEEARLLSTGYDSYTLDQHPSPVSQESQDSESDHEEEEEEEDPSGFLRSNQRVFFLLIDALSALIIRLWLATISVSLLMYILRRVSMHSLIHHSGSLMSDAEVEVSVFPKPFALAATPALFGQIITTPIIGPLQIVNHEACTEFTHDFPVITLDDCKGLPNDLTSDIIFQNNTNSLDWIGLVERGGCPFDQKIYNMQNAGFKAVLVFNQMMEPKDATIRMSAHSKGSDVTVFTGFMSRRSGSNLHYFAKYVPGSVPIVKLEMKPILWISKKLVMNALIDMWVLFILVVMTGTGFFVFGVTLNLIHNLFVHGQFYALETIHEASLIILAVSNQTPTQPKLKTVEFPRRSLDENSLLNDWRCGGIKGQESCPICIEDFQIGDQVRELPCQHIYHDTCVDPWLLKHNRLCPVCKRDVLRKKPKHRHTRRG